MRTATLLILYLLCLSTAYAQRECATETVIRQKIKEHPELLQKRLDLEARLQKAVLRLQQNRAAQKAAGARTTATIPVVVHIVLRNPAQVTDAQVMSQLSVLNQDYTATNTDISQVPTVWQPIIGNTALQFCLAQRTPAGDPTNGIVRVTTTRATFDITNAAQQVKYASSGGSDAWDSQRYLNIWVCDLAANNLGVATMPGLYSAAEEGVVVDYTAFGTSGTAASPYNGGRTAVHEIGHFFSLRHTWGDENACAADDGIDDTPKQAQATYGCPTFPKTDQCSPTAPGIMFQNYMDYTDDACMHLFTTEQSDLMRVTLDNQRVSLLSSDGCQPVNMQGNDAQISEILSPVGQICENTFTPLVVVKNKGSNTLRNVTVTYQLDDGLTQTAAWSGSLASLQTDTVQLTSAVPGLGLHILKAYTSQPNGAADADVSNDTAWAAFTYSEEGSFPFSEGFEGDSFPPPGWELKNYDNSFTWEITRDAAKSGRQSIVMRNLGYNRNGPIDDLFTPVFDARNQDSVFLFFDVAAATYSGVDNRGDDLWDSLMVLATTDCGVTFDSLYKKGGPTLATHRQPVTTEYIPTAGEWRRDSINLTPIIHKGKFRIVFRNISNAENNIYLDNINLVTKATLPYLREHGMLIGPIPTSDQLNITFLEPPPDLDFIALYNVLGQLVAKQPGSAINSSNRFIFDLVNEPNGVYFVKLIYRKWTRTIKIIKAR